VTFALGIPSAQRGRFSGQVEDALAAFIRVITKIIDMLFRRFIEFLNGISPEYNDEPIPITASRFWNRLRRFQKNVHAPRI